MKLEMETNTLIQPETAAADMAPEPPRPGLVPKVPDETIHALVESIDKTGFAVLENFIAPAELANIRSFIESTVEANSGEYLALNGIGAVRGTLLEALSEDPNFQNLLARVYEVGTKKNAPQQSIYQVCRCLKGETGKRQSLIFHYDSYVVTALLPIIIPTQGLRGDLVALPNTRRTPSTYILNLFDKILLDNKFTQYVLKQGFAKGFIKYKKLSMTPGNLYFFWGCRTIHANEPCDVDNIRSTALFHFGDPYADSGLRRRMGRVKVA